MAGKFYVVRRGRQRGIFTSWAECQEAVLGYAGASYKSFASYEEAMKWWSEANLIISLSEIGERVCAYTDGSYCKETKKTAYGLWIPDYSYSEAVDTSAEETTNNYNELMGIYRAAKWFGERDISGVVVTDSEYSLMAIGEYVIEWERSGTVGRHPNGHMIVEIRRMLMESGCSLAHIRSHRQGTDKHSKGNEYVDELVRGITGG